jgi:hypothetical protein
MLTIYWIAARAGLLLDAHRLPLASDAFDMVISTAMRKLQLPANGAYHVFAQTRCDLININLFSRGIPL